MSQHGIKRQLPGFLPVTPLTPLTLLTLLCCLSTAARATDESMPRALQHTGGLPVADSQRRLVADLEAYQKIIDELEANGGAFDPALTEPLLGLGHSLARAGEHRAAIEAFKRGIHLARINDGLYSERQVAPLQGVIASHVALGEIQEADERQRYLHRVQVEALSDAPRSAALMQYARWQRRAFEAGLGEQPGQRLLRMWDLNQNALTELAKTEGEGSTELLKPLYGMLRAQYLLTGFVGETSSGQFRTAPPFSDWEDQQRLYRSNAYGHGTAVIRAIYDVRREQPGATLADTADALMMLGDWQFWNGKRTEAAQTYAELDGELAQREKAQQLRAALFAEPRPLPALKGVRALPEAGNAGGDALLLQFGVDERGKVVDLVRLDEHSVNDGIAESIMRRVQRTLFRPRISDGMPVATAQVVRAYDTSNW